MFCGRFAERLKSRVILHGVTDFDLFSYKFRVENGVYGDETGAAHESFVTLKKLEHLFESVAIHLPTRRRTDVRAGLTFGSAVCRVAVATAAAWCDDSVPTVRAVVRYFGGQLTAGLLDAGRQSDTAIERRVLATVPHVRSLRLVDDYFFLAAPSSVLDRQLRGQITAVDQRLTAGGGLSVSVSHATALTEAYGSLREICIDVGLVRRGDPELPERPPPSAADVVPLVRHLLRLACGTRAAARRTEPDQRFTRLVGRLYDDLVGSVDLAVVRAVERSRDGRYTMFTQRRSVANSAGCFQRRLSVCLFVCQHDNLRTSKHRME